MIIVNNEPDKCDCRIRREGRIHVDHDLTQLIGRSDGSCLSHWGGQGYGTVIVRIHDGAGSRDRAGTVYVDDTSDTERHFVRTINAVRHEGVAAGERIYAEGGLQIQGPARSGRAVEL